MIRALAARFAPVLLLLFAATPAHAVPEMARFGYFSCTTCHVSPAGGGALTAYGRGLSAERLSTWSYKGEEELLGVPSWKTPEWLILGGDFRNIQTHYESATAREGRWIRMQSDVSAAFVLPHVTASVAGGPRGMARGVAQKHWGEPRLREYWVKGDALDSQLQARVGRFYPRFGLMVPQHTVNIRRDLGFDQGKENLNAELTWLSESDEFAGTALLGARDQELEGSREKGIAAVWNHYLLNKHRIGVSVLSGKEGETKRAVAGLNGIFALSDKWFLMSELDHQSRIVGKAAATSGLVVFNRLGFEPVQGVVPIIQLEQSLPSLKDRKTRVDSYALGSQWYPRPHFDLEALVGTALNHATYSYAATAYFLIHYYL